MKFLTRLCFGFALLFMSSLTAQHVQQLNWDVPVEELTLSDTDDENRYTYGLMVRADETSYLTDQYSVSFTWGSQLKRFDNAAQVLPFSNWELPGTIKIQEVRGLYGNGDIAISALRDPWNVEQEISLARVDSTGRVVWQHTASTTTTWSSYLNRILAADIDINENIYVAGRIGDSTPLTFDFTLAGQTLNDGWGWDIFIAKFSPSGQLLWIKHIKPDYQDVEYYHLSYWPNEFLKSFSVSQSGTVNIDYHFDKFVYRINDSLKTQITIPESYHWSTFDTDGTSIAHVEEDLPGKHAIDSNNLNCRYELKNFSETIHVGDRELTSRGGIDFYFAKYSVQGDLLWLIHEGDSGDETAKDYAFDSDGNLYITGEFANQFTVDGTTLTSTDNADIFVLKYDTFLGNIWAISHRSPGSNETEKVAEIEVSQAGQIYLTGNRTFELVTGANEIKEETFLAQFIVLPDNNTPCNFSDSFEAGTDSNWVGLTPARWDIVAENRNHVYSINTTQFLNTAGGGLGEYVVNLNRSYSDFEFSLSARTDEDLNINSFPDFAIIFSYENAENYYYAHYNGEILQSQVYQVMSNSDRRIVTGLNVDISDNQFHKISMSCQGDLYTFYLDGEVVGSFTEPGLPTGAVGFGSYNDAASFDNIYIEGCSDGEALITTTLPRLEGAIADTVTIPIILSTEMDISFAQMVVEYDSTVLKFITAENGTDAAGFSLLTNTNLPFSPSGYDVNDNILIQLSDAGVITGIDQQVAVLKFFAIGLVNGAAPLLFDMTNGKTSFTSSTTIELEPEQIAFQNGAISIIKEYGILQGSAVYFGKESTISGAPISAASVTAHDFLGTANSETDETGSFIFNQIIQGPIEVHATKNGDNRRALSGNDALLLLNHLAFLETLTANQMRAADTDQNGTVSGSDTLPLLKFLAFFQQGTAETGAWIFDSPQSLILGEGNTVAFNGYTVGDVNLNWTPAINSAPASKTNIPRIQSVTSITLPATDAFPGDTLEIPLVLSSGRALSFLQIALEFDSTIVQFIEAQPGENAQNMSMITNTMLPFAPHNPAFNKNIILQLSSATTAITGENQEIAILRLAITGSAEQSSQIGFDLTQSHTVLVTQNYEEITADSIIASAGLINVLNPSGIMESENLLPTKFSLQQNYPNPFNPQTHIEYAIPVDKNVQTSLKIYNVQGQLVRVLVDERQDAGVYNVRWDGRDKSGRILPSGLYLYELKAGDFKLVKRMILLK
ncbi:MAG: T9SS C-terminal target domain-containing protein [Calditrichaeota bacterium]|nr:MAG: T9SS C-terminal target domain-containing protein [Calditrichota bacterium]